MYWRGITGLVLATMIVAASALPLRAGSIVRTIYDQIPGTNVLDLTASSAFPDSPSRSETLTNNFEGSSNFADDYGSLIRGWITAPATGNYTFWICSQDSSELYLSTDEDPANKRLIAIEPVWNNSRAYDTTARRSTLRENNSGKWTNNMAGTVFSLAPWTAYTIPLTQARQYYIEARHKAGEGNDNLSVSWEWTNTVNGLTTVAGEHQSGLPISAIHLLPFVPPGTAPNITQQPMDVYFEEFYTVTFFVNVEASPPVTYQWYRNGTAITNGTGNLGYFTILLAKISDNGSRFKVRITNPFGSVDSTEAIMSGGTDATTPVAISASTRGNPNAVGITFSEEVTDASAINRANYSINGGVTITNILKLSATTVRLLTTHMVEKYIYTVTMSGIKDTATVPNNIAPGSQLQFSLISGLLTREFYDGITGVTVGDLTNRAAFQNHTPSSIAFVNDASLQTTNRADNYGSRIVGYLVAPVTGLYSFFISSRDASSLFLSYDDNPANKFNIANETAWSNPRQYLGQASGGGRTLNPATGRYDNQSADINLIAGRKYYFEALHKAGVGPDSLDVTWQIPGNPPVTNGDLSWLSSQWISAYTTLGQVLITNQPASIHEGELVNINLTVGVDGTPVSDTTNGYTFQWQKSRDGGITWTNTTVGSGNNSQTKIFNPATLGDSGQYRVIVSNWFSSATSAVATLSIDAGIYPPTITSVIADDTYTRVTVTYSRNVLSNTNANSANTITNYALNNGMVITNIVTLASNKYRLELSTKLVAGTLYTLTVNNVADLEPAVDKITPNTTAQFSGWVWSRGTLRRDYYANDPTNSPVKFPDQPDDSDLVTAFDSTHAFPNDSHTNYTVRVSGLLTAPLTGSYRFFLRGDDPAELWWSPDTNRANQILIAHQDVCCQGFTNTGPSVSVPISLTNGQQCYVEAVMRGASGTGAVQVAWRMPGENQNSIAGLAPIPGDYLTSWVPPDGATVSFVTNPTNQVAFAFSPVTFVARAVGTSLYTTNVDYQWQKAPVGTMAFTDIPGAVTANYTIRYPTLADNNFIYRAVAMIAGKTINSSAATLRVFDEPVPPRLIAAVSMDGQSFTFLFNRPISSVVPVSRFSVSGGVTSFSAAVRADDPFLVDLQTSPLVLSNTYIVTITGIRDIDGDGANFTNTVRAQMYLGDVFFLPVLNTFGKLAFGSKAESDRGFRLVAYANQGVAANLASATKELYGEQGTNQLAADQRNLVWTNLINFSNQPRDVGHLTNDFPFPYLSGPAVNHVMLLLGYMELTQGIHRWGINSDDGFYVSNSDELSPYYYSSDVTGYSGYPGVPGIVLGSADGSPVSGETQFDFIVPQDGIYPVRFLYYNTAGDSNVEWWEKDTSNDDPISGPWYPINGIGGPKVYQPPIVIVDPGPVGPLAVSRTGNTITLVWPSSSTVILESTAVLGTSPNWTTVTGATNGTFNLVPSSTNQFFRLRR